MTDVQVQAERPPVIGWRYTLPADAERQVVVVAEDPGAVPLGEPQLGTSQDQTRAPRPPSRKTRPVSSPAGVGQPGHPANRQTRVVRQPLDSQAIVLQEPLRDREPVHRAAQRCQQQ